MEKNHGFSLYMCVLFVIFIIPASPPPLSSHKNIARAYDVRILFVLLANLVPVYLVNHLSVSRHFFKSPSPFRFTILKFDISSPGYLVILTSVRALFVVM